MGCAPTLAICDRSSERASVASASLRERSSKNALVLVMKERRGACVDLFFKGGEGGGLIPWFIGLLGHSVVEMPFCD